MQGDCLITNRAPSEVGIHTNMLGQLMLGGISSNLESPSAVTVKRSGRGNWHTKILQEPTEPDDLLNSKRQRTELSLNTGASNSSLLLGLPNNKGRPKEQTVTSNRVTIIETAGPGGIGVRLQLKRGQTRVEKATGGSTTEVTQDLQKMSIVY